MWLELQIFGFRALWSPFFFLMVVLCGLFYHFLFFRKFKTKEKPTIKQQISFYIGLLLLYIAKGSPVDLLSHITLTAHMIQMATFLLLVPILFIKGLPAWVWEKILLAPKIKPIVQLLTKPVIALLFFNGLFSFYHLPLLFNFSKETPVAHFTIHAALFFAAFIMWLPLMAPVKEINILKPLLKIVYIFVNSVLITPACAMIIFAPDPLYEAYMETGAWITALSLCVPNDVLQGISGVLTGPDLFSPLGIREDQQLGGIVMKLVQEFIYGTVLVMIIRQWFKEENRPVDPLPSTSYHSS